MSGSGDPVVFDAARRAVEDHCERVGLPASVEQIHHQGIYRVRRRVVGEPRVSVVIPTGGSAGRVRGQTWTFVVEAVRSVVSTSTYPNLRDRRRG